MAEHNHLMDTAHDNCQVDIAQDNFQVDIDQDNHCRVDMAHENHHPKAHENRLVDKTHDILQEDMVHEIGPVDKPHGNCHGGIVHDNCQECGRKVAYTADLAAAAVVVGPRE
jgi:hypothetical protein